MSSAEGSVDAGVEHFKTFWTLFYKLVGSKQQSNSVDFVIELQFAKMK